MNTFFRCSEFPCIDLKRTGYWLIVCFRLLASLLFNRWPDKQRYSAPVRSHRPAFLLFFFRSNILVYWPISWRNRIWKWLDKFLLSRNSYLSSCIFTRVLLKREKSANKWIWRNLLLTKVLQIVGVIILNEYI